MQAECDRRLAEARREAEQILADAKARATSRRDAELRAREQEMTMLDDRWRLKGEAEAARAALSVQNDMVERVLARVRERIREGVNSDRFPAVLDALLDELLAAAEGEGEIVVLAPPKHADHVRGRLESKGRSGTTVEGTDEFWDGVGFQNRERTFRVSNTLSGRYRRVEQQARRICMTRLFHGTELAH